VHVARQCVRTGSRLDIAAARRARLEIPRRGRKSSHAGAGRTVRLGAMHCDLRDRARHGCCSLDVYRRCTRQEGAMIRTQHARVVVGALACAGLLWGLPRAAAAGQDRGAAEDAAALRTFTEGVERYAALRARYAAPLPPFDERRDPWSLKLSRHFLASAIRTARHGAARGDIFTPPVAALFRATIAEAVYAIDIEGLVDDEAEAADLAVNEPVPVWALQDPPGALLAQLPSLPSAIEYRLVGGTLILWDADAEILIDALPRAVIVP
jgi:hypothetical protein